MEYVRKGGVIAVRLLKGEEVVASLTAVAARENIAAACVSGIGAVGRATIGVLRTSDKRYGKRELEEDMEIASLTGNISVGADGKPYLHLHVVLGGTENVYAGHLNEAYVSATAEIFVNVFAGSVGRFYDDETGLNLMKFED